MHIVAAVGLPGAIHITVGNFIEPRLMGRGLELHPVTVLLALAFWGLLWGIIGMVLAVPIVAMLRIVSARFTITRPLANILAGRLPGADAPWPMSRGRSIPPQPRKKPPPSLGDLVGVWCEKIRRYLLSHFWYYHRL